MQDRKIEFFVTYNPNLREIDHFDEEDETTDAAFEPLEKALKKRLGYSLDVDGMVEIMVFGDRHTPLSHLLDLGAEKVRELEIPVSFSFSGDIGDITYVFIAGKPKDPSKIDELIDYT